MKYYSFVLILTMAGLNLQGQPKTHDFLRKLLYSNGSDSLKTILSNADSFRCQIIYTKIDRLTNKDTRFTNYYFNVDRNLYFNPASMVKLPVALLALEKLDSLRKYGIDRNTPMFTDSSWSAQSAVSRDSSSVSGFPTIGNYVRKIFLVSDNDAYNRLYEFVGQQQINRSLAAKGYRDIRITRRFVPMDAEQNRHTNQIRFGQDPVLYTQAPAYNSDSFDFSNKILIGRGHWNRNDSLIEAPMDFTTHNNAPLEELQMMLQSVLFPGSVTVRKDFNISEKDRLFLYRAMSEYPYESRYPAFDTSEFFTSYTKFFWWKHGRSAPPAYIRSFNKTGWSYGFLTDVAYIVDYKNQVDFMISATIYVNSDGILNDNRYEYETTGYGFFKEVGQLIYQYELQRKKSQTVISKRFSINYEKPNN